jgi:predicted nuclease of predicted toxin-antitoxin system
VTILLDENFPLPLYHRLKAAGHDVEHIIMLGQRGLPDAMIRQRLMAEDLVFLTQDTEFEDVPSTARAVVIISRVAQSRPISQRVEIWLAALGDFLSRRPGGKLFDLLESGEIVAWGIHEAEG